MAILPPPKNVTPLRPPTPFELVWFSALDQITHAAQLVKGLLIVGTLFVVYGESNSGKTFWILDLCLAIAAGRPWRGKTTRQGLVLYVAGEGAASVKSRVVAYRKRYPEIPEDIAFAIIPQAVDFLSTESIARLIETLRHAAELSGRDLVLVVIDTFARSIPGANENDAADVGRAVAAADHIRAELKCAVGWVHHAGKDPTKGARGSSALRAACDTEILIEGVTSERTVTVSKQRDLEPLPPMGFELAPVQIGIDEDGEPITSCTVTHKDGGMSLHTQLILRGKAQRQLVAAIRARSEKDPECIWTLGEMRQVGKELGISKSTAHSAVDALAASPYLQPTIGGYRFVDGAPRT